MHADKLPSPIADTTAADPEMIHAPAPAPPAPVPAGVQTELVAQPAPAPPAPTEPPAGAPAAPGLPLVFILVAIAGALALLVARLVRRR